MPIDYLARAEENFRRESNNIDKAVDHYVKVAQTQGAIVKYIKEMAEVLAESAIASEKALGDSAAVALQKWTSVLQDEASRLIREKKSATKALPDPKVIDA